MTHRADQPDSDFTIVYHLLSFDRNMDIRIKTALKGEKPSVSSIVDIWRSANWYEREIWDMFGIRFEGHPHLKRNPHAPDMGRSSIAQRTSSSSNGDGAFPATRGKSGILRKRSEVSTEEWGMKLGDEDADFMFLNLGPQHPGTHGLLRIILALDGEEIADAAMDIGYHHRGAEKMAERQSWHTFIRYTDRIDYLGGVMNNFAYIQAVESLAGIQVPEKAQMIRIMMAEFFRISSHLVWYGTFAQDLGAMSPVFYMFNDRERVFDIVSAITGGRMHPAWFRIGGVSQDLPKGWDMLVDDFIQYFPARLVEYDKLVMQNRIFKARTQGIGAYTLDEAIDWGVTGPGLRACGLDWDFRKKRPYSGYDKLEFDVPTAKQWRLL